MRKYVQYLVATLLIVLLLSSCIGSGDKQEANLGDEFALGIGESIVITDEDLSIKFIEVSEDSRCPRDVICVWEGRVIVVVEVLKDGSTKQLNLSQPGLNDDPSMKIYGGYELTYEVEPYPEKAEVEIKADEYRLRLIVNK